VVYAFASDHIPLCFHMFFYISWTISCWELTADLACCGTIIRVIQMKAMQSDVFAYCVNCEDETLIHVSWLLNIQECKKCWKPLTWETRPYSTRMNVYTANRAPLQNVGQKGLLKTLWHKFLIPDLNIQRRKSFMCWQISNTKEDSMFTK